MKKVIAIFVVFALVAGAAFAETAISGTVETRFTFLEGTSHDQHDHAKNDANSATPNGGASFNPKTYGSIGTAYLQFSGQNDNGTVGALWRFRNTDVVRSSGAWWHRAFVWWKPIPQLRVFLGIDNDGMYSTGDALTDWAFHQGVENYISIHDWGFWRGVFPGHWDSFGLSFNIYPLEGWTINLTIPTGGTGWPQATDGKVTQKLFADHMYLAGLKLQTNYNIPDIGRIFLAYDGPGASKDLGYYWDGSEEQSKGGEFGLIGVSFLLEAFRASGLRLQVGISTPIEGEEKDSPFTVGLGLHFAQSNWGIKFRAAGIFTSNKNSKADGVDEVNTVFFNGNIMPWYKLSFMTIYCDLGISILTNDIASDKRAAGSENDGLSFWINPYFKIPLGGPALEGGVMVRTVNVDWDNIKGISYTAKDSDPTPIRYAIPIRFVFSF